MAIQNLPVECLQVRMMNKQTGEEEYLLVVAEAEPGLFHVFHGQQLKYWKMAECTLKQMVVTKTYTRDVFERFLQIHPVPVN